MSDRFERWVHFGLLAGATLCSIDRAALAQGRADAKSPGVASQPVGDFLRLEIGTQQVLPADNVRSYSEGVQGVVDVRLTGDAKSFVIVALRPGQTTLLFIMMDGSEKLYRITVFDPNAPKPGEKKLGPPREQVLTRDNIRLDFYFVQFDKSYSHQIGVDWASRYGGGSLSVFYNLQAGALESATATIQDQTLPALDLAQATGWAKLQRHATLITANGTKATFTGGGEINIPVQGSLTTGIHKIEFGSTIGVQPRYDSESGRLELEIHADVSDLADDRGTGTPGRLTSTLDTLVNLELGQSLMLAGLVAHSQARGHSGIPVLSQIPILGALFGRHSELAQETEDVVFIVPSVLDAISLDGRARIREALDAYEEYTGDIDKHHLRPPGEIPDPKKPASIGSSSVVLEPEGEMIMPSLVLHIDDGKGEPRRVEVEAGEQPLWLGRDASCEVVLAAPQVSRKHISLRMRGRHLQVEDHSANGTRVDESVLRGEARDLHPGRCTMRLGPYTVSFDVPGASLAGSRGNGPAARLRESAPGTRENSAAPPLAAQRSRGQGSAPVEATAAQRRDIHKQLLDYLELPRLDRKAIEDESMRRRVIEALRRIIAESGDRLPRGVDTERLTQELTDEALGLGPLESLLADATISEIMVVDPQTIYAEVKGKLELTPARFTDNEAVRAAIERIVTPLGRRIDESTPLVDARLKDGSRVNAIIPPLALKGPCITIRKFSKKPLQIQDLIGFGSLNERMAKFLTRAVRIRKNIIISGGTGSGKTTLLNVLSGAIPEDERVVTIEDAAELQLAQPHVVSLESRPANLEGKGAFTIRDLVKNALRMRPDRIVVGECRGSEAIDMLQAMNTGHEGSMTTTHANSPREAVARIETLCLMAGVDLPVRAIRAQIASSVHLIVQQSRLSDGSRRVTAVAEVAGIDDDGEVELNDIYSFVRLSTAAGGKVVGEFRASGYLPSFVDELITSNVAPDGDFV